MKLPGATVLRMTVVVSFTLCARCVDTFGAIIASAQSVVLIKM